MATTKPVKRVKPPKSMAACADLYYELKTKRLAAQKLVDEIEKDEKLVKEHIIKNLPKSQATGIAGKLVRVAVTEKEIPQVKDWELFFPWVAKNKAWDMLQHRISPEAVQARLDAKKKVPGVEIFKTATLSMNKI